MFWLGDCSLSTGNILNMETEIAESLYRAIREQNVDSVFTTFLDHEQIVRDLIRSPEPFFLHEACKIGNVEIVQIMLDYYQDIFSPSTEGSPLKLACENGHTQVVELLLKSGAYAELPLSVDIYSPCYQATSHGHHDIVDLLIENNPDIASVPSSCAILLYAACVGGHLDMVQRWLDDDRNINQSLPMLGCHPVTAVMGAAQSGNVDVLEYLLDRGGTITPELAHSQWRDIVGEVLHRKLLLHSTAIEEHTDQVHLRYTADWQAMRITALHSDWLKSFYGILVHVNLSGNMLTELPKCLPWEMPVLEKLDVSHNALVSIESASFDQLSLKELNLSNNKLQTIPSAVFHLTELESLFIRNNELISLGIDSGAISTDQHNSRGSVFHKSKHRPLSALESGELWCCYSLQVLDASHNQLGGLPHQIECCGGLRRLILAHNQLKQIPTPWPCPLDYLDVSFNRIETLPASMCTFWSQSLKIVYLQHNRITEMGEAVCGLGHMIDLDLSHNKIKSLPHAPCWKCHALISMNLSHNRLSNKSRSTSESPNIMKDLFRKFRSPSKEDTESGSSKKEDKDAMVFPSVLQATLTELDLSHNNLHCVPESVSRLSQLLKLKLSHNSQLHNLTHALGNLSSNCQLHLDGLRLSNIPVTCRKGFKLDSKAVLAHLRAKLRMSVPYDRMKLVVVGRENRGKTTLMSCLKGKPNMVNVSTNGIAIGEWKVSGSLMKKRTKSKEKLPDITFTTWDMGGQSDFYITHQCFLSDNSLYLVVWDLRLGRDEGVASLHTWLSNIQARAPNSSVIIVGTFLDCIASADRQKRLESLRDEVSTRYFRKGFPKIVEMVEVSGKTQEGISSLEEIIYTAAMDLTIKSGEKENLIGRKVPKSYIQLEMLVQKEANHRLLTGLPPVLTEIEFTDLIARHGLNKDISTAEERTQAARFLHEAGLMLHFDDELRGLNSLYFLDPSWLADLMAKIITIRSVNSYVRDGILLLDHAKLLFLDQRLPERLLPQYIQLLERFEIALAIDQKRLLIPSKLPLDKPGLNLDGKRPASVSFDNKVSRLYMMAYIPSGFWSRLITRLIIAVQRLVDSNLKKKDDWTIQDIEAASLLNRTGSWNCTMKRQVDTGLKLPNKRMMYWREGIIVTYTEGYFMLESPDPNHNMTTFDKIQGVYITVQSQKQDYSMMGFLVDQIESLVHEWFPGLQDSIDQGFPVIQRLVPCPVCLTHSQNACSFHDVHLYMIHECAWWVCEGFTSISCPKHDLQVSLTQLAPDLLLYDLPKHLIIDPVHVQFFASQEKLLGYGAEGAVYRGQVKGQAVAIKQLYGFKYHERYRQEQAMSSRSDSGNHLSRSSKTSSSEEASCDDVTSTSSECQSRQFTGYCTEHMTQLVKSLSSLRQEVMMLSQLRHPCIVALLGVHVPHMYFIIELAPLGSLQALLEQEKDKQKMAAGLRPAVLSRPLTYKIILQVSTAVEYLHKFNVTYRDLKPDNILMWSLDTKDAINIKLSDYGISSYNMPQGVMGCEGTPGYQAPEVKAGVAYNEKVDIFSLAMVIYSTLSGEYPYAHLGRTMQRTHAVRQGDRPSLKHSQVMPQMPALEALMSQCWAADAAERPSAAHLTTLLKNVSLLSDRLVLPDLESEQMPLPEITCMHSPPPEAASHYTWLWTGAGEQRMYHVLDISQCTFKARNKCCPGGAVQCMTRVGRDIWIGTQDKELEVIGYSKSNQNEASSGFPNRIGQPIKIDGVPLSILHHTLKIEEDIFQRIYVSQSNGRVTIFIKTSGADTWWDEMKTLFVGSSVQPEMPARCMALADGETELWVGVGHSVVIISTYTLMIECRLDIFDSMSNLLIAELVVYGERAWVACHRCSLIVEIDTDTREKMLVLDCSGNNILYRTILQNMEVTGEASSQTDTSQRGTGTPLPEFTRKKSVRRKTSRKKQAVENNVGRQSSSTKSLADLKTRRITAMIYVKDTLWVARGNGDILVISTNRYGYGYPYGQVLAVFEPSADQFHYMKMSVTNMDKVLCASVVRSEPGKYQGDHDSNFSTLIFIRDAYGTEDIHHMHVMWRQLDDEEEKLDRIDGGDPGFNGKHDEESKTAIAVDEKDGSKCTDFDNASTMPSGGEQGNDTDLYAHLDHVISPCEEDDNHIYSDLQPVPTSEL